MLQREVVATRPFAELMLARFRFAGSRNHQIFWIPLVKDRSETVLETFFWIPNFSLILEFDSGV